MRLLQITIRIVGHSGHALIGLLMQNPLRLLASSLMIRQELA